MQVIPFGKPVAIKFVTINAVIPLVELFQVLICFCFLCQVWDYEGLGYIRYTADDVGATVLG